MLPSLSPLMRMCIANLLLGFVLDLILVGSIKGLFRRPRPVYNKEGDFVLVVSVDKFSFPSGHSSRCAARLWVGWGAEQYALGSRAYVATRGTCHTLLTRCLLSVRRFLAASFRSPALTG